MLTAPPPVSNSLLLEHEINKALLVSDGIAHEVCFKFCGYSARHVVVGRVLSRASFRRYYWGTWRVVGSCGELWGVVGELWGVVGSWGIGVGSCY